MAIPLEILLELVAMFITVVVLAHVSLSVYRKNPSERLNQLFALAAVFPMLGFLFSALGTLPGVTVELSILATRLLITGIFWGVSFMFLVAVYLNYGYLSKGVLAFVVVLNCLLIIAWLPGTITANPNNPSDIFMSPLLGFTIPPIGIVFFLLIWYLFYRVYVQSSENESVRQKFRYFLIGWTIFLFALALTIVGLIIASQVIDAIGFCTVALGCFIMSRAFRS